MAVFNGTVWFNTNATTAFIIQNTKNTKMLVFILHGFADNRASFI